MYILSWRDEAGPLVAMPPDNHQLSTPCQSSTRATAPFTTRLLRVENDMTTGQHLKDDPQSMILVGPRGISGCQSIKNREQGWLKGACSAYLVMSATMMVYLPENMYNEPYESFQAPPAAQQSPAKCTQIPASPAMLLCLSCPAADRDRQRCAVSNRQAGVCISKSTPG